MHSTPDPAPTLLAATSAAGTTFLDALRGLGFTEQDPHPDAVHTTFRHGDHDRGSAADDRVRSSAARGRFGRRRAGAP